jgi:ferrous iron transport protein A
VTAVKTEDEAIMRRLMTMGVSPGISITLEQQFPSYIIKVGRTVLPRDRETAQTIYLDMAAS